MSAANLAASTVPIAHARSASGGVRDGFDGRIDLPAVVATKQE